MKHRHKATSVFDDVTVRLRPASEADWPMIQGWLRLPAIEQWWGPASRTEGEVIAALKSEHAIARIIEADGEPIGYAHALDATTWGEALPDDLPPGTWDLDLFIADSAMRGRGLGAKALAELKNEVFATTLAVAVCVFPSISNEHAVRAYEKAGFIWQSVHHDPVTGPSWFMIAGRDGG